MTYYQVWWIPQIPMKAFTIPVNSIVEGVKLMDVLADYDKFQYENNIKPDYCNAGGLAVWDPKEDGEGTPDWYDWEMETEDGRYFDDPREYLLSDPNSGYDKDWMKKKPEDYYKYQPK